MKKTSFCLLFLIASQLSAQKQDYNWIMGFDHAGDAGAQLWLMDWKNDTLEREQITLPYSYFHNNASISDADGNLLIASNGCAVFNRNYEIMPSGDSLNWDQTYRELLRREDCNVGYPGAQQLSILPDPKNENGYYIIHKTFVVANGSRQITSELRSSYVDMELDDGYGDLTYKDEPLFVDEPSEQHLQAMRHSNGKDWWILQPVDHDSTLLTMLIDEQGITVQPQQDLGFFMEDSRFGSGTSRFSPDGNYYALFDYFYNLHLYDFDRATGKISNHQYIKLFESENLPDPDFKFGSVEWSSNSRFVYVAVIDSLMQVDTWEENVQDGVRLIDTYIPPVTGFPNSFYIMALAPDCKIYLCSGSSSTAVHVIHEPNNLGEDCNFVQEGLRFPENVGGVFPLHPRFRVDEEEKCNPNITSVFGELVYWRRDLTIYPNPASEIVTVQIPESLQGYLVVMDMNGQIVYHKDKVRQDQSLDVSFLEPGVYSVEYVPEQNKDRIIYTTKMVVID